MSSFSDLAFGRRSIRKYEDKKIPLSHIEEIIRVAVSAPSGCNSQCWKFVVLTENKVINGVSDIVTKKVTEILNVKGNELPEAYLASKIKMLTFFAKAPVVIAVFMTKLEFHDLTFITTLKEQCYSDDEIMRLFAYPDLLSVGAAIQNLLLAVHEKGYGACWMNDPAVAGEEIREYLGLPIDNKFISLIPIGFPAYTPRNKKMKDFNQVFSVMGNG